MGTGKLNVALTAWSNFTEKFSFTASQLWIFLTQAEAQQSEAAFAKMQ